MRDEDEIERAVSVSPEEPRPTLRQQIAAALEYETIENDLEWDKWSLADVVLGLEPIRRALRIAVAADEYLAIEANPPTGMDAIAEADWHNCRVWPFVMRLRAVGVVDPKPAGQFGMGLSWHGSAPVDTQP